MRKQPVGARQLSLAVCLCGRRDELVQIAVTKRSVGTRSEAQACEQNVHWLSN